MKKALFLSLAAIILFASCQKNHFITDRHYRSQVHADFQARQQLAQGRSTQLFGVMDTITTPEREALEFLYAYMPYSDLADYDGNFFLQQVRTAFQARTTFSWGQDIPEDIFRHFVLVYRVNNENLDTARTYFFHQLRDRVKDLPIEEAALEVNHWCHEHVAYRAADGRTSAPLATMRTSLGRCGEESTFTVTALRSVGIPARQCYTPRWAHCDDNHAWVEVWANGEWKFLGACEPDPELNMGWFSVPSTRCMMVHTKAFGRYRGDEEVVQKTNLYSELNLLSHYAPTKKVTITVHTPQDQLVPGAHVKFKLYNYSEYYTLADVITDQNGQAQLTTGLGDLLIWANKGNQYNYAKLDVRQTDSLDIYLSREPGTEYVDNLDIVPPMAGQAKVTPTKEKDSINNLRKVYEDSLRDAYTATFPTRDQILTHRNPNLTDDQLVELIQKSEGNHQEVLSFIDSHQELDPDLHLYDYLRSYSDKDLRDVPAANFEQQLNINTANIPYEVFHKGLQPARISNELIRPWRQQLPHLLSDLIEGQDLPTLTSNLKKWILTNIAVDDTGNYYNCPISPVGVFQLRHSDAHSRDIFFVAACRSLSIPAYLDNATNTLYAWDGKDWQTITFEEATPVKTDALITLTYSGKDPAKPIYYPHFTLQKFTDGEFISFDFEDDPRMATFPAQLQLEPGYYCLSTGNRYAEGDVLSRMEFFQVKSGNQITKEITLRPLVDRNNCNEAKLNMAANLTEQISLSDYAGTKGILFLLLGDYKEPSKHLTKELTPLKAQLQKWGGMTYLEAPASAKALSWDLPNTDCMVCDGTTPSAIEQMLTKALGIELKGDYPLVVIVSPDGNIKFHSQGYKIGLAELIIKNL